MDKIEILSNDCSFWGICSWLSKNGNFLLLIRPLDFLRAKAATAFSAS